MVDMKSIIIAAPHSGSGKTTITLGIMECLRKRGLKIAPFKVGPDFIDPGYHKLVTGKPSINLDGWMCSADFVRSTFTLHSEWADMTIIEGVMGLFDGIGESVNDGSTAQIARITGAPVVLVVDAKSMAGSAAPLVKGFAEFDTQVNLAAVIFNNVGSENHANLLKKAMATEVPKIKVLGCIGRDEKLHIPSRHLGLLTAEEHPLSPKFLQHLSETIEECLDVNFLCRLSEISCNPKLKHGKENIPFLPQKSNSKSKRIPIAVARDEAFCFIYEDNLRLLQEAGGEIIEFSPLSDATLPHNIGGIYLPGGYPEIFTSTLAANVSMKESIAEAIEKNMPVYAECGGFIYLTKGIMDDGGSMHDLVGVFPVAAHMLHRRKALGYKEIVTERDSILGKAGLKARGHEFHYSEITPVPHSLETLYRVCKQGTDLGSEGFSYKNCLASYIHLHFGSCSGLAAGFVESCEKFK